MTWLLGLIARFAAGKNVKLIGIGLLTLAIVAGTWWFRGVLADAEKTEALERAIAQAEKQRVIDAEIYNDHLQAIQDVESSRTISEENAQGIATPDCKRLGSDWLGMFNSVSKDNPLSSAASNGSKRLSESSSE